MKIYREISLEYFEFWSSAKDTANELTTEEFEQVENALTIEFPDGLNATELNDLFWFEDDYIANILGYDDFESLQKAHRIKGIK